MDLSKQAQRDKYNILGSEQLQKNLHRRFVATPDYSQHNMSCRAILKLDPLCSCWVYRRDKKDWVRIYCPNYFPDLCYVASRDCPSWVPDEQLFGSKLDRANSG
jgi:hypothetical protein